MQWDSSANAGFSKRNALDSATGELQTINVQSELRDSDSILHSYKRLIRLRKEEPVIAEGH